jgi:hypothetical protein
MIYKEKNEMIPAYGEIKRVRKFAWFPTLTTAGFVWLDYYYDVFFYIGLYNKQWILITRDVLNESAKHRSKPTTFFR